MKNNELKNKLLELVSQFNKQDNPIILREISLTAFKLMNSGKKELICCPTCKEIALLSTYSWATGDLIQVFSEHSIMRCENNHAWKHLWVVGERFLHHEPINQYYVYECVKKVSNYNIEFKKINGVRHFPWNNNRVEYDN